MSREKYEAPTNARPWDRMTGETAQAYAAFLGYKELPLGERSISRLASDMGRNYSMLSGWSVKWGWQNRLAEWDANLEREKEKAAIEEARRAGIRQAAHLHAIERVLILPVEELVKRIAKGDVDFSELSPVDLFSLSILTARAYPRVALAERLVRGQATEIVSHAGEPIRPAQTEEDIAAFWAAAEIANLRPEDFLPPVGDLPDEGEVRK